MRRLLLLFLAAGSLNAAEKTPAASYRFFTWDGADTTPLYARGGKGVVAVDRPSSRLGIPVRLAARKGVVALYAGAGDSKRPAIDDKTPPAATFVPTASPRQIVLVMPVSDGRKLAVIDDGEDRFPYGSTLVLNLSRTPVDFEFDGVRVPVRPDERLPVRTPAREGEAVAQVVVSAKSRTVYTTVWPARRDLRRIVFIHEPRRGEIQVRVVTDRLSPTTAEAPAADAKPAPGGRKPR